MKLVEGGGLNLKGPGELPTAQTATEFVAEVACTAFQDGFPVPTPEECRVLLRQLSAVQVYLNPAKRQILRGIEASLLLTPPPDVPAGLSEVLTGCLEATVTYHPDEEVQREALAMLESIVPAEQLPERLALAA